MSVYGRRSVIFVPPSPGTYVGFPSHRELGERIADLRTAAGHSCGPVSAELMAWLDAVGAEGQTQVGLGVRARLPFRVLQLSDRVVVDVAHSWTSSR